MIASLNLKENLLNLNWIHVNGSCRRLLLRKLWKIKSNQIEKKKQKNSQKIKTTQTGKLCWQPNLFWMRAAPQEKSSRFFLHIVVVVALLSINGAAIGFSQSFHVNGKSRQTSNRSTVSSFWLWKAIFHFHLNLLTNHHPNATTSLTKSKQPLYNVGFSTIIISIINTIIYWNARFMMNDTPKKLNNKFEYFI